MIKSFSLDFDGSKIYTIENGTCSVFDLSQHAMGITISIDDEKALSVEYATSNATGTSDQFSNPIQVAISNDKVYIIIVDSVVLTEIWSKVPSRSKNPTTN